MDAVMAWHDLYELTVCISTDTTRYTAMSYDGGQDHARLQISRSDCP